MMRRSLLGIALAFVAAAVVAGCGGGGSSGGGPHVIPHTPTPTPTHPSSPTPKPTPTPIPTATPTPPPNEHQIKHIVIVVQENRSFDNLFAGYPGADAPTSGQSHTGQTIALAPWPLEAAGNLGHMRSDFLVEYNGGNMNGFDLEYIIGEGLPANFAYSYVPRSETKTYWSLAQQYTLSDHMFQSDSSDSFAAHQFLIAAQSGQPPNDDVIDSPNAVPWGCDAPKGTTTRIALPGGSTAPGPFPCFDYDTLATRLNTADLSWKYYSPAIGEYGGNLWSAYDANSPIRFSKYWAGNVISPETTILKDVANGNLPAVSWVVPSQENSDHPDSFSASGPDWVGGIVNTIGKSKYWSSTAIFVLWDDWGGWYDNVQPPQLDLIGLGFRVPFLVISPYAKHNYVSHVQYEYGSIVKFVEWSMVLPNLGQTDLRANPLFDCFDFSQQARAYRPLSLHHSIDWLLSRPRDMRAPDEY